MKKAILILLLAFFIKGYAQTNIINITERCNNHPLGRDNGTLYLKDVNNLYETFLGTWKWSEGKRKFVLTLIKQTKYHYNQGSDDFYEDRIVGYYVYLQDEFEVINTTDDNLNDDYGVKVSFDLNCYSQLSGTIYDVLKNKTYSAWFEIISPTKIRLKCKEQENSMVKEGRPAPAPVYVGNTFPLDMVLTKQ